MLIDNGRDVFVDGIPWFYILVEIPHYEKTSELIFTIRVFSSRG